MLINPMEFYEPPMGAREDSDKVDINVDFSFFQTEDANIPVPMSPADKQQQAETKKKRGRPAKAAIVPVNPGGPIVPVQQQVDPAAVVTHADYSAGFADTGAALRGTILQIDQLAAEIKSDIDDVRSSKTMKSKYTYLTNLNSTAAALLNTKIAALKEINANTAQVYKLDMDRMKALKADESDKNDDIRMMDMYTAFINAPTGTYNPLAQVQMQDTVTRNAMTQGAIPMGQVPQAQMTPEQARMRMESNPNIQNVVRFDPNTGARCFDVIDRTTGQSIPNYPRLDEFLLEHTVIDTKAGIARNRDLNQVWPLVPMNGTGGIKIAEY
ncbi:hypothetical protein [uncultured Duncaniella sp.]|uniref:hypothetical protein n=1 Tax=uncultured Duncaniella sp. TaxID=2768039 RepID=UPI0026160587|nr:hypothetical protein [uncultured Duncaniella sp.]